MDITIEWAGDDAEVRWLPADGELEIQPSLSPIELAGDFSACVASGGVARFNGIGQRVDGVFRRCFFLCRDQQNGRWVAASPHVDLQGAPNFRDYGGYLTAQGRQVAWGKLFRSGQLASLTDIDAVSIRQLDIGLVFDFRQDSEQLREPSRFAHGAVQGQGWLSDRLASGAFQDFPNPIRVALSAYTSINFCRLFRMAKKPFHVRESSISTEIEYGSVRLRISAG